jgi:hypothetical protein
VPARHTGSICQLKQQIKHVKPGKRENNQTAYLLTLNARGISGAAAGKNFTASDDAGLFLMPSDGVGPAVRLCPKGTWFYF